MAYASSQTNLYLVTNMVNGNTYVGVTKHKNIKRRLSEHFYAAEKKLSNGRFHRAIRKYGRKSFNIELLNSFPTRIEAFNAEIEYISNNSPKYNSTLGGDGSRGHKSTPKVAETNKKVHSGNKYRLGKKHSDQTKYLLKELGHKNIEIFKEYMYLGPKKSSKSVICTNDGKKYNSASEAARFYNVSKSAIIEICLKKKHRKSIGGLSFEYMEAA